MLSNSSDLGRYNELDVLDSVVEESGVLFARYEGLPQHLRYLRLNECLNANPSYSMAKGASHFNMLSLIIYPLLFKTPLNNNILYQIFTIVDLTATQLHPIPSYFRNVIFSTLEPIIDAISHANACPAFSVNIV